MNFQILVTGLLLFLIIWSFFKYILPRAVSDEQEKKTTLGRKKEALDDAKQNVDCMADEVSITRELKRAKKKEQSMASSLQKEDEELRKVDKGSV